MFGIPEERQGKTDETAEYSTWGDLGLKLDQAPNVYTGSSISPNSTFPRAK